MEPVIYHVDHQVAFITLNRPEVYHALNRELLHQLTAAFSRAEADPAVRVIVLTGEGTKAFCSGADLKGDLHGPDDIGEILRTGYIPLIQTMRSLPKPIIGRINGVAVGAGCSLALACDVRIAATHASMAQLFVQIGLVPDAGSTFFLPRLVGPQKAFELASTGRTVNAAECLSLGLVNEVAPADQLDDAVSRWTDLYSQAPTRAIGAIKQLLNQSYQSDLTTMLELEMQQQQEMGKTADFREGVTAFRQKRKANFSGA